MRATPYPVRPITEGEFDAAHRLVAEALNERLDADHRERMRRRYEFARSLAAYDGDEIIGLTGAYSLRMAVPGGSTPVAGITTVVAATRPTSRCRPVSSPRSTSVTAGSAAPPPQGWYGSYARGPCVP